MTSHEVARIKVTRTKVTRIKAASINALAALAIVMLGFGWHMPVWAESKTPVVLELFTSQGCSSCPPADKLLTELAQRQGIIALSRPVQYWDRLGWKDTLATPENTRLQYAYADQWRTRRAYTPQLVVNGVADVVGGQADRVAALIATEQDQPRADVNITAQMDDEGNIEVVVTGMPRVPTQIKLLRLRADVRVDIERGENARRQLHYINSVVSEAVLADWAGAEKRLIVSSAQRHKDQADRWVILVQRPGPGRILAAQYLN